MEGHRVVLMTPYICNTLGGNVWAETNFDDGGDRPSSLVLGPSVFRSSLFAVAKQARQNVGASKIEFHVEGAGVGIFAIGWNFAKAETAIHGDGIFHDGLNRIEAHAVIADMAGLGDKVFGKDAAEALAAKGRAKIKTFHFADCLFQSAQSHASSELAFIIPE